MLIIVFECFGTIPAYIYLTVTESYQEDTPAGQGWPRISLTCEENMEALNAEIFILLLCSLAFGSALIHYTAYAKAKARVKIKSDLRHPMK